MRSTHPQMLEEKSFCPAFGRSDCPAGETDERRPSDQETAPHALVNFARRLMVNLGSPLTRTLSFSARGAPPQARHGPITRIGVTDPSHRPKQRTIGVFLVQ